MDQDPDLRDPSDRWKKTGGVGGASAAMASDPARSNGPYEM